MNDFTPIFLKESISMLREWEAACLEVATKATAERLERLLIAAHNLKGGAALAGFDNVRDLVHQAEQLIEELRMGQAASTVGTVRILMRLSPAIRRHLSVPVSVSPAMNQTSIRRLLKVLKDVAAEEAGRLGLSLDFFLQGDDFSLSTRMAERLTVPLTHLLRNALVHGVADQAAARPFIRLLSADHGQEFSIEVMDSGCIDDKAIYQQAIQRGILDENALPRREELLNVIFLPGFSSKNEATGLSGRGMGMTIVQQKMEELAGRVELRSEPGKGTAFRLVVPFAGNDLKTGEGAQ